jgi:hypothetical protein
MAPASTSASSWPSVRRMVASAGRCGGGERGRERRARRGPLECVGGPLGDRGDRLRPGRHSGGGQAQDGDQRVAAATSSSWVGDGGQVGEQVQSVGVLELAWIGLGEVGQGGWDRRC